MAAPLEPLDFRDLVRTDSDAQVIHSVMIALEKRAFIEMVSTRGKTSRGVPKNVFTSVLAIVSEVDVWMTYHFVGYSCPIYTVSLVDISGIMRLY